MHCEWLESSYGYLAVNYESVSRYSYPVHGYYTVCGHSVRGGQSRVLCCAITWGPSLRAL
jgi:hypothetical protein